MPVRQAGCPDWAAGRSRTSTCSGSSCTEPCAQGPAAPPDHTHLHALTLAVDGRVGVKVVGPAMVWPARHICDQVHGPAKRECDYEEEQPNRREVAPAEKVTLWMLILDFGDEHLQTTI